MTVVMAATTCRWTVAAMAVAILAIVMIVFVAIMMMMGGMSE